MKASELIEKLAHYIVLYGDKEVVTFNTFAYDDGSDNPFDEVEEVDFFLDDNKIHIY